MPKRIIDGDALWKSNKLAKLPPDMRAEYANLIPLALANGSFECDPRIIWATVYFYNRPEVTIERVTQILDEFERAGMLIRWTHDGKPWGYWVGIDKPGRLPPASRITHEKYGELPPTASHKPSNGEAMASHSVSPAADQRLARLGKARIGRVGLGRVGLGLVTPPISPPSKRGGGNSKKPNAKPESTEARNPAQSTGAQKPEARFSFCVMPGCGKPVQPGQPYCSDTCRQHAAKILDKQKQQSEKQKQREEQPW